MSDEVNDFGRAEVFDVEAIGRPGNRRFRLFAISPRGTASLWMERDQIDRLNIFLEQLLAQITGVITLRLEAQARKPRAPHAPDDFPDSPEVEFQVGRLEIEYREVEERFFFRATPIEVVERDGELFAVEGTESLFAVNISRTQASFLSAHINAILAGGRPRCPFCNQPMQAEHECVKQNGYHPASLN